MKMKEKSSVEALSEQEVGQIVDRARAYMTKAMKEQKNIAEDWARLVVTNEILCYWLAQEKPDFSKVAQYFTLNGKGDLESIMQFLIDNETGGRRSIMEDIQFQGAVKIHDEL